MTVRELYAHSELSGETEKLEEIRPLRCYCAAYSVFRQPLLGPAFCLSLCGPWPGRLAPCACSAFPSSTAGLWTGSASGAQAGEFGGARGEQRWSLPVLARPPATNTMFSPFPFGPRGGNGANLWVPQHSLWVPLTLATPLQLVTSLKSPPMNHLDGTLFSPRILTARCSLSRAFFFGFFLWVFFS